MNIFSRIGKAFKIVKTLLSNKTESEIHELSTHIGQAVKETGDVVEAAKELGQETEEMVDEVMVIATLTAAILKRFWEQHPEEPQENARGMYPDTFESLVDQGVSQM